MVSARTPDSYTRHEVGVADSRTIPNLDTRCGLRQVPATLPPGNKPPFSVEVEAGWTPEPVWTLEKYL